MAHEQSASAVVGRQHDHQRGEHARSLFRIAMLHEKASRVVNQELVEFNRNRWLV
jgi:hypothetical protein